MRLAGRGFLLLLGLRLAATVFLLPPWSGFDELYHQGYVEADAEHVRWAGFREIRLPDELVAAARTFPDTNYETQQSPLYYAAAGLLLRLVPRRSPFLDLYLLRLANAVIALAIGWVLRRAALVLRLGWGPVALLAVIPGFAIATCRVSNDALCGLLISIAVLGALGPSGRGAALGCAAAGLAPWAKLYGLAVLPGVVAHEATRRGVRLPTRAGHLGLIVGPPALLVAASAILFGHPAPIMYNVRLAPPAAVGDVPWIRDAWVVLKSHIWVSDTSFRVFPNAIYLAALGVLLSLLFRTLRSISRENAVEIGILAAPLLTFGLALVYQDWRAFSFYGGGGATGGWYVWAMAVPEMLLLAYGSARSSAPARLLVAALALFFVLAVVGDCALVLDSAGALLTTGRGHLAGIGRAPLARIANAYLSSRPRGIAICGLSLAVGSWVVGSVVVSRVALSGRAGEA